MQINKLLQTVVWPAMDQIAALYRAHEISLIVEHMASRVNRLVADQLTDVHWSVGRGFGFTFPDPPRYGADSPILGPVVRIDHIFVSDHLTPQEIHVIPSGHGSDHQPVVATLRLNGE